ncbi:MAG: InlB B-repeat-containing protein [Chloroflexota bacterium]
MTQKTRTIGRASASVLLVGIALLALLPGIVEGRSPCRGGRCPTPGDDGETKCELKISITIEPADAGTVMVNGEELEEGSSLITQGEPVTLEANPEQGYVFADWSGDITSTDNPLDTPFYNHKSITASFALQEDPETTEPAALQVDIPDDTTALHPDGGEVTSVSAHTRRPHDSPDDKAIVGDVYELGPDGATFDPALPLSLPYDDDELPEGVDESDLVIAWFDEETHEWVELDSTVDETDQVVTALADHFTDFCVLAAIPETTAPTVATATTPSSANTPGLSLSGLSISPVNPRLGEEVNVSVVASYSGDSTEGRATVTLTFDGEAVESKDVSVPADTTETVAFTYVPSTETIHTISVNGLQGTMEVASSATPSALAEAVARAEEDSFALPSVSLPDAQAVPGLPGAGGLNLEPHWWWILLAALLLLTLVIALPLVRRYIIRYRYDI